MRLARGTTLTAPGLDEAAAAISTRMVTATEPDVPARLRACHLAVAELGAVVGDLGYYERICQQLPEHLRDKEPWRVLFARRDGADVGFAAFRRTDKWEQARPNGSIAAWAVVGDAATRLALLRRLVDFDLISTVKVGNVGADDPLLLWAGGPRATAGIETYDSLWIRLVDLPEALMDRTWGAPCDVVLDVADRAAPWNEGRWRVHADESGTATVERTTADADVRLPVEALGAAYLGGANLLNATRAGLVTEQRAPQLPCGARALRSDVTPTAAVGF